VFWGHANRTEQARACKYNLKPMLYVTYPRSRGMEEVRIYFKGLKMNHLTDNNAYPKEGVNSQGSAGRRSKDITIITMFNEV
jgi:hypothetical protein